MKYKLIFILSFLGFTNLLQAQTIDRSVIHAAGGQVHPQLLHNVGETFVGSYGNNNFMLTQGFIQPQAILFIPAISGDLSLCLGDTTSFQDSLSGGSWSSNNLQVATINANTGFVTTVGVGTALISYSIGDVSVSAILEVHALPTPQISHTFKAICPGGNTKVIASGGTNYLWSNGQTTDTATFTQAGNYKAIVTNAYGCVDSTASVQIQVKNIPTILVVAPTLSACQGEQVTLSLYPNTNIAGFDMQWYVNASPIAGATSTQYSPTESGSYSLSVTGGSNCTNSSVGKTVIIKPTPTATYTTSGTTNLCTGGKVTLTANMLPVYTNVNWLKNGTVITNSPTYKALTAGNYQLVVNQNGCRDTSAIVSVTINPKPVVSISTLTPTICSGNTTMLTTQANTTGLTYQWLLNQSPIAGATDAVYATTIGGIYRVIANNVGCTSLTNNQKITVNATPAPTITPQSSTTIGVNGSVKLTATYIANATYQWYLNNTPIAGATKRDYKAISGGDYTVEMSKLGCTGMSAATTVTQTGVKEEAGVTSNPIATEDTQFEIKAYPNPVSNLLTINVSGVEEVNATIQVMDFSGKLVATKEMKTTSSTVDMTGYASGVYLIRYKDAEGRTGTIKITKE